MKALAVDSATSCMTIAAKNGTSVVTLSLDVGMKQSQKILPAINYVLEQVEIKPSELDYMALCTGPGTFTGLRLSYAALKALELSCKVPLYGVPTLDVYSYPYRNLNKTVISVIDAKKDQFFAAIYKNGIKTVEEKDTTAEEIASILNEKEEILLCGTDAKIFAELLAEKNKNLCINTLDVQIINTNSLFEMTEKMIVEGLQPLQDYDGPLYLRKSEAELALDKR